MTDGKMEEKENGNVNETKSAQNALTADLVADAGLHRLVLQVGTDALTVLVTSRVNENFVIHRRIPFTGDRGPVEALEEVVYDNSLLTADFHSVDVVIDNNRFFVMEAVDADDAAEVRRRVETLWPAQQQTAELQTLVSEIEPGRTKLVSAVERRLLAFVRRTWNNPAIRHRMAVEGAYAMGLDGSGYVGGMFVNVDAERVDVVVTGRDGLYCINRFAISSTDDAAFYVLALARHFEFDNETDRVVVDGSRAERDALTGVLRKFVAEVSPHVRPERFPSASDDVDVAVLLASRR